MLSNLNNILVTFFGLSVGSVFILGIKSLFSFVYKLVNKSRKKDFDWKVTHERKLTTLEVALVAVLHDKIYKLTDEYILQGFVTLDDLDNLEYLYTAYINLGGNGTGEKRYNRVQQLPTKRNPDSFVKTHAEVTSYDYERGEHK